MPLVWVLFWGGFRGVFANATRVRVLQRLFKFPPRVRVSRQMRFSVGGATMLLFRANIFDVLYKKIVPVELMKMCCSVGLSCFLGPHGPLTKLKFVIFVCCLELIST